MINYLYYVFTLTGLIYFFKYYKEHKLYLSIFLQFLSIFFILYWIDAIWKIIAFGNEYENQKLIIDTLIFVRSLIIGTVGAYFLVKLDYPIIPFITNYKKEKEYIKGYSSLILFVVLILFIISIFLLELSSSILLKEIIDLRIEYIIDSINRALIVSVGEEFYFRLFLQSMITYWLIKEFKYADYISIIITSILWATIHSGLIESGGFKFIQIFLFGIVLGLLMRKKGLESCIAAHAIFNFIGYVFLGGFKIVS